MKRLTKRQKCYRGFTLIELMLTITVSSIVISLATPSFTSLIKSSRQTASVNSFVGDYNFARSEAVKRGQVVTMCERNTAGGDCDASKDWDDGWIIFVDIDGDATFDAGDGDTLIRIHDPLGSSQEIFASKNRITISPVGFTLGYNTTFKFCDDRGSSKASGRVLDKTGRLRQHIVATEGALTCS